MATTIRYIDTDGARVMPGEYTIIDTRVHVTAITRPNGITIEQQDALIVHTVIPITDGPTATDEGGADSNVTPADAPTGPPGDSTIEWNVLDHGDPYLQPWTEDENEARSYSNVVTGPLVYRTRTRYPDRVGETTEHTDTDADDAPVARHTCPRCGKNVSIYHEAGASLSCTTPAQRDRKDKAT